MIETMCLFIFHTCFFPFLMCQLPVCFWNNPFMDTIVQHIIFLLYNAVFISCTRNFLVFPSSISQLSTVYRIIQNALYKWSGKCVQCIILSFFLFISMLVQPCSNRRDSHIGMNKFVIDQTNNLCFVLCNLQFSIYQFIAIWSKSIVPFSFPGFLLTSLHCLNKDILSFNLCHRRQNRNHQLSTIFWAVNSIFYTDQIHSKILHPLQRI